MFDFYPNRLFYFFLALVKFKFKGIKSKLKFLNPYMM